jgi:hypothetical protein
MSDTVPASVITAFIADRGPSFVLDHLGTGASATAAAIGVYTSDFRVGGAVHSSPVSGFGSPLLVDFVTWCPAPASTVAPPTVAGSGAVGSIQPEGLAGLPPDHSAALWGS